MSLQIIRAGVLGGLVRESAGMHSLSKAVIGEIISPLKIPSVDVWVTREFVTSSGKPKLPLIPVFKG